MTEYVLHPRITENNDWVTVLILLCFITIAVVRFLYEHRFSDFANLLLSDKYNNIYKESSHLKSGFTVALFFVQIISFSFFIQFSLSIYTNSSKTDWIQFVQIINFILFFILAKFLIEKIIGSSFFIEELVGQFNLQKVTYLNYIALLLLPVDVIFFYLDSIPTVFPLIISVLLIIAVVFSYTMIIKKHQKLIFSKLFYFILYLCTLEMTPYYLIYFWLKRGLV